MSGKVFVQEVKVFWSKASRGAPLSTARNLCPEAFELSPTELAQLMGGGCYSSVVMRERDKFSPDQRIEAFSQSNRFQWPSLSVMFLNTEIVVRYEYAEVVEGAPSRLGHPAITYPLPADSLLRVKFNSRDSWPTGEWHYHQTLFSVLRTERPSTTMFLSTPKKTILDLEDLW